MSGTYIFREMTIADYEGAYFLWSETDGIGLGKSDSKDGIERFLARNPGHCFVCEHEGRIVGTVLCGQDGRRGFLYHVAVSEAHRGQGIGKALLSRALESLTEIGITKCHLMVMKTNVSGAAFWEYNGWQRREDILIYSKSLAD